MKGKGDLDQQAQDAMPRVPACSLFKCTEVRGSKSARAVPLPRCQIAADMPRVCYAGSLPLTWQSLPHEVRGHCVPCRYWFLAGDRRVVYVCFRGPSSRRPGSVVHNGVWAARKRRQHPTVSTEFLYSLPRLVDPLARVLFGSAQLWDGHRPF